MHLASNQVPKMMRHREIRKNTNGIKSKLKKNLFDCSEKEVIDIWIKDQLMKLDVANGSFVERYDFKKKD